MPRRTRLRIRRVILTLDQDRPDEDFLELAGTLASTLEAELSGLFLRTEDEVNLAALPGVQSVISGTGARRELQPGEMERSLVRAARRMERHLEQLAARRRLRWSFEMLTGDVEDVLRRRRARDALFAFARPPRRAGGDLVGTADAPLLIAPRRLAPGRPIVSLFEGNTETLALGARLAGRLDRPLRVAVCAVDERALAIRQRTARGWLTRQGVKASVNRLEETGGEALASQLERMQPALIVAGRGSACAGALIEQAGGDGTALLLLPD